ncbi:MAG TPA: response regulator transcription factor [Pseudonocardia sp.]|nr:response regulator transcription factor [Pseudonocardia sp.]
MIRIAIVDDDALLRAGLRLLLETQPDLRVVTEAGTGREAVQQCRALTPDVILMDLRMPGMDGVEATRQLTAGDSGARVLVLTTFDDEAGMFDAVRAGASGFLLKRAAPEELLAAVRAVAAGEGLVSPAMTLRLLRGFAAAVPGPPEPEVQRRVDALTAREREVLVLLARGLSNAEVADRARMAETTAKTHVARVLTKLGLRDRVQAVVFAYQNGLVRPGDR